MHKKNYRGGDPGPVEKASGLRKFRGRLAVLLLAAGLLQACGKEKADYELNVRIEGLENGEMVYLYKADDHSGAGEARLLDSQAYANPGVVFEGSLDHACLYSLSFGKHRGGVEVFLDQGETQVLGHIEHIASVEVKGQKVQELYAEAIRGLRELDKKERVALARYMKAEQENRSLEKAVLRQELDLLKKERDDFALNFAAANPASPVGPYLVGAVIYDLDYHRAQPVYEKLSAENKAHPFGKALGERMEVARKTAVGEKAPGFEATAPDGSLVSLQSSLGKRLTLIDFWASWCAPCRNDNPYIVQLYEEYKPKGLEIIGISLDEDPAHWKEAIQTDGLGWVHLSDLRGFRSEITRQYGVMAIPQTFLLDAEGVIIARGLRGEALRKKIEELLGS